MAEANRRYPVAVAVAVLALTGALASGCSRIPHHVGYIGERVLTDSIEPAVDNRASVQATLGRPTFTSQFNEPGDAPVWYYVSRETRQLGFNNPSPVAQDILAVTFDGQGNVATVEHIGTDQVASIDPYGRETPTLGRHRGFFQELFGNVGALGQAGQSGQTADNPDGN